MYFSFMNKIPQILYCLIITCLIFISCEKKESKINKKIKHTEQLLQIKEIADNFYTSNEIDSSYYYFNKLNQLCKSQRDTALFIYSSIWIAQIQLETEDYSGSETTLTEALPLIENSNKYPNGKYGIYLTLGNNYLEISEYKLALLYYQKANVASKLQTESETATSLNNIALVHIKLHNYTKAKQILLPLINKRNDDPRTQADIIHNLGYSYLKTRDSTTALNLLNKSLKIRAQEKDNLGIIASYLDLSEYYHSKRPILANQYILKAYQIAKERKANNEQFTLLKELIKNNTGEKSKEYTLQYIKLNDSISRVRQKTKNQFAKIKYDSKKLEDENTKLKTQKALNQEKQKYRNLIFYSIFGIGIIMLLSIVAYFIRKNKKEKIKTSYETETRIAKKIHDELANDVYQTLSFGETQDLADHKNRDTLLNKLETIYSRIRNISKENSTIETGILFTLQLKDLITNFNNETTTVIVHSMELVDWESVEVYKKIGIFRVIQELLVNMKKHSLATIVIIRFQVNQNKLHISYSDNGIGTDLNEIITKSGIQNMENRIFVINGTMTFDSKTNEGFKANIHIPI